MDLFEDRGGLLRWFEKRIRGVCYISVHIVPHLSHCGMCRYLLISNTRELDVRMAELPPKFIFADSEVTIADGEPLGKGSFGEVRRGTAKGLSVCVKVCKSV